jgi:2-oxo-3-hexenedioate decarboxylase
VTERIVVTEADPRIGRYATELLDALDRTRQIPPITDREPSFDDAAAYQVSAEILRRRRARGERPIGRKIGFTNRTIWPEYGVYTPMWAHVYDSTVTFLEGTSGSLSIGHLAQPRIEPEILLHFERAPAGAKTEAEILACIDWIAHSVEIVQSHFPDWKFKAADTAAAFGLHGALVVGPPHPVAELGTPGELIAQLRTFTIALARNGEVLARGGGANVLDSPLLAFAHLQTVLENLPQFEPVQAGEIVTTGTLTAALPIEPGQTWSTDFEGLGLNGLRIQFR